MPSDEQPGRRHISRRDLLRVVAGGGVMISAGIVSTPALAANKIPHKTVRYQPTPKGRQRCDNCLFWQPPGSCKLVQDPIAASGWCTLYKKK